MQKESHKKREVYNGDNQKEALMLQKQFVRPQFQTPKQQLQQNHSRSNNTPSFSPKVEYANPSKKSPNSPKFTQPNKKNQNDSKPHYQPYELSSQSYESYYQQKFSMTNSVSGGQSQPSKYLRTERSKNNMKALQEIKEEQQNILKLKQKYSTLMKEEGSKASSTHGQNYDIPGAIKLVSGRNPSQHSESYDKKIMRKLSKHNRHMKTETSNEQNLRSHGLRNQQQTSNYHQIQSSNNNTYTRSINNSFNPRYYQNEQSQTSQQRLMSPSQEYYSGSYQNQHSANQQQQMSNQLQVINQRYAPFQSRDASTLNTQHQRPSSLSLNKFSKKPMHTFYHCDAQKFFKYNDEGYLTDREIALREKVEKAAEKAIDRLIIEQEEDTQTTIKKARSLDNFPKLNKLKGDAEKQRKIRFELYGKYQNQISKQTDSNAGKTIEISKQRSYVPSELPPSSSLSKKRFHVIYKGLNQNILEKNLVDDSYHEKQQKQRQSHIQEFTENARSSIIKKSKQKNSKISQRSSQKQQESLLDYEMMDSNKKNNQQSAKGISKIGGIASHYMVSSKKDVSSAMQESKASQNKLNRSKPSFVEEFSDSSISDVKTSSKHSARDKKVSSRKQSKRECGKSSQSQNLNMLNSNYKKMVLTDQELKVNGSDSSLKLKTNTEKDKKNEGVERKSIKVKAKEESVTSEENFESQEQLAQQQSTKSVKSSHIGLTKEPLKRKKSNSSKLSEYGSESVIDGKMRKKDSGHKWIRESGVNEDSVAKGDMRKKDKASMGESILNLQKGREGSDKNFRLSVESNSLKLDSLVNLPKTDKIKTQNRSKIDQQTESNHTESRNHSKNQLNQSIQNQIQHPSQSQLLQDSINQIQKSISVSKKSNKSRLSMQRQTEESKLQKSKLSSHTNRLTINNQNDEKEMKQLAQKYGNYLKVDQSKQPLNSESQSESRAKSYHSHTQKQNSQAHSSQHSQYFSQNTQEMTQGNANAFSLTQRAQELLQIEQNLHEKRRNLQNQQIMTEDFQEVLAKIEAHISIIKEILFIATTAIDIYSDDSPWLFKSCLLSLKKYHLERVKVVQSLRGKKSCFNIAQNELPEEDLKQFLSDDEIVLLANDIEYCNDLNQKMIEEFVVYLRDCFGQEFSESQINLRPFNERFDLGLLLQEYRTEILGLREKASPSISPEKGQDEEVLEQETEETIKMRIFKLMEVSFLLSELTGKRIKEFTEEIDIQEDFDEYFSDNWPYFERIVKTFS